jgi:hypothetical protein
VNGGRPKATAARPSDDASATRIPVARPPNWRFRGTIVLLDLVDLAAPVNLRQRCADRRAALSRHDAYFTVRVPCMPACRCPGTEQ